MRTWIALLLALLLTGCTAAVTTAVKTESVVAEPPQEMAPEEELLRYLVSIEETGETAEAEDGTPLAAYTFRLPVMTVMRGDGSVITAPQTEAEEHALTVAAAFNERFDKWAAANEFQDMTESARLDYAWRQEEGIDWPSAYTMEMACTVYRTERLVSVSGEHYSYTGGAHPNVWRMGWNFDLESGMYVEPELLGEDAGLQESVAAELARRSNHPQEDGSVPAEGYWEDYEDILAGWTSYAVSFDGDGMNIVFSPYELAAYAMGAQEFHLSYEWLKPYLSDYGRALLGIQE